MVSGKKSNAFLAISTIVLFMIMANPAIADLSDGLVAYYPFNGSANDESGYSDDGIVYGATLTIDRFGNSDSAYSFDGLDDYIDAGDSTSSLFDSWDSFTLAAWVKPSESSTYECIVGRHDDRKPTFNYGLFIGTKYTVAIVADQAYVDSISAISTTILEDNTWYHAVGVYDDKNMKLYVNGIVEGGAVFPVGGEGDPLAHLYIGNTGFWAHYPDNRYFDGVIDDVRIYDRALSDSEVYDLYVVPLPGALLLGCIGLSLAGWKLQRRKEFF